MATKRTLVNQHSLRIGLAKGLDSNLDPSVLSLDAFSLTALGFLPHTCSSGELKILNDSVNVSAC